MRYYLLCNILLISFLTPLAASTQNYKTIDRDSFSLKYPSTWSIDTEDEDYDPDALFSLDAPNENGTIMFMFFDIPIDPDDLIKEQEKAMREKVIKKPTSVENIVSWGKYQGKGIILKGKVLGVFKGYAKVFVYSGDNRTFLVMEQFYDNDRQKIENDISTIVTSFSLK